MSLQFLSAFSLPGMKRSSLTEKMILYFLALGIGAILITGLFSFHIARKALLERAYEQLTSIRLTRKAAVERFFKDRMNETAFLAEMELKTFIDSSEYYSGFFIFDSTGHTYDYHPEGEHFYIEPSLLAGLCHPGNDCFISDIKPPAASDRFLLSVCRLKNNNTFLALMIKSELIDSIMLEVNPEHGLGYSGETYLIDHDYLMRTKSRFIEGSVMKTKVITLPSINAVSGKEGTMLSDDYRSIKVLSSYGSINVPGLDWSILAEFDYSEATTSISAIGNSIIVLCLVTAIALFLLTYTVSKRITLPLKQLKSAVADFGNTGHHPPLQVLSNDEFGELTEAFNQMTLALLQKDLVVKEERLKRVSAAIDSQEKERQRLSRELHDGIGQGIIGIRLRLAALENKVSEDVIKDLSLIIRIIDVLVDEIRTSSNALMPPALAEFGLNAALQSIARNISDSSEMDVTILGELADGLYGRKPVLYIFRILQEAMNNAAKHSQANRLEVKIDTSSEFLKLEIADNGIGFDPETAHTGNGLSNLKERVNILNGVFEIRSAPGNGTIIRIRIPINKVQYDKVISG